MSKAGAQWKLLKHLGLRGSGLLWLPSACVSAQFPVWKAGLIAPPCPSGKDSGRVNSALPLVPPSCLPRDFQLLGELPAAAAYPNHGLPRFCAFSAGCVLLDQAQVQVRSSWKLMKSQVLVCLEIQTITFLRICIVLYCCCGSVLLHPASHFSHTTAPWSGQDC